MSSSSVCGVLQGASNRSLSSGDWEDVHVGPKSLVGLVAGWLAAQIGRATGFGLIGDLLIGIAGAFIGDWLLPQLGIHLGVGILAAIINATIGALEPIVGKISQETLGRNDRHDASTRELFHEQTP